MNYLLVLFLLVIVALVTWFFTKQIVSKKIEDDCYHLGFQDGVHDEQKKNKLSDNFIAQWDNNHMEVRGINPLKGIYISEREHGRGKDIIPKFGIDVRYYPNEKPNDRNFKIGITSPYNLDPIIITPNGISDGYHTFDELYYYRMLYNSNMVNLLVLCKANLRQVFKDFDVIKSKKHFDKQPCYGGGWFIVVIKTPWGQISNHYKLEHWDNFKCRAVKHAWKWDNHTMKESTERMIKLNDFVCKTYEFPKFK